MYDWSDIPAFLAVMRDGSAAAAARRLHTNQTTISRRIARLETALGLTLFEFGARGASPTANARALLPDAEAMEASATALSSRAGERQRELTGVIRLTTVAGVPRHLTGLLRGFQRIHPGIGFDIDTSAQLMSLEAGEADIAVRVGDRLQASDLIARRVLTHPWAFYGSDAHIAEHGLPRSFDEMPGHAVVAYAPSVESQISLVAAAQSRLDARRTAFRVTTIEVMQSLIQAGEGFGLLPRAVGDASPGIRFCFTEPGLTETFWMVWSQRAAATPHIAAFLRYCSDNLDRMIAALPAAWKA
ncbi:LysR family transcriptional regulator [Jannaschia ovalis]|uniref:LysR family transcriptional regulator n=1 Tax=Jannaschia ovalis TaxID=3038773 RepID=A0ABY8LFF4_9RHOB|nr:LysR family transcriptional regulator [Jannaschia sp. GRR-S6-38]WGH80036.1 LysR family transcriptional regulator [Jannaschia sp. GRR-S6-38]